MPKPSKDAIQEYAEENQLLAAYRRAEADLYENTAREAAAVIAAGKRLPKRFRHLRKG